MKKLFVVVASVAGLLTSSGVEARTLIGSLNAPGFGYVRTSNFVGCMPVDGKCKVDVYIWDDYSIRTVVSGIMISGTNERDTRSGNEIAAEVIQRLKGGEQFPVAEH